jgi:hypothetical protein
LYPAYRQVANETIRRHFTGLKSFPLGVTATVRQVNTGVRAFGSAWHNVHFLQELHNRTLLCDGNLSSRLSANHSPDVSSDGLVFSWQIYEAEFPGR